MNVKVFFLKSYPILISMLIDSISLICLVNFCLRHHKCDKDYNFILLMIVINSHWPKLSLTLT